MKLIIESTTKTTYVDGIPARIWEGQTDSGIKIHCYITSVAIDINEPRADIFEKELIEHKLVCSELETIPLYLRLLY